MNINQALADVENLYIETAPFIYYVEENPDYIAKMDAVFELVIQQPIAVISSVITLTEVLSHPMSLQDSKLVAEYEDILINSSEINLVGVSAQIAHAAAKLRASHNLRTPDALHIATAIDAGCEAFLTNDAVLKRVAEIQVLVLGDLELSPQPDANGSQDL